MKTITIDVRWLNSSGIGSCIKGFLKDLIKNSNYRFFLIGNSNQILQYFKINKIDNLNNIKIIECNLKMYSLLEQILLPFIIPLKTEIYIATNFNVPIFYFKKSLIFIYDMYQFSEFSKNNFYKKLYLSFIFKKIKLSKNKIITISNFSKNEIIKITKINTKKIFVCYLGSEKIIGMKNNEKIKIPKDRYILFVGNIKPHKNIDLLLQVIDKIYKDFKIKLVIIGKVKGFITPDNNSFSLIEKNSDKIYFYDEIDDFKLIEFYKKADLLVSCSLYEGFNLPPIEAMRYGVPSLVSDIKINKEIYKEFAYYFNSNDAKNLLFNIIKIFNNYPSNIYKKSIINYSKKFSWDRYSRNVISIINNYINEK